MRSTKIWLLRNLAIKAAGLRAEFGSYCINGHLFDKGTKDLIPRITY